MPLAEPGEEVCDHLQRADHAELGRAPRHQPAEQERPQHGAPEERRGGHEPEQDRRRGQRGQPGEEREEEDLPVVGELHAVRARGAAAAGRARSG